MGELILTPEMERQIVDRVSLGEESLRSICRDLGISHTAFLLHCRADGELANQYARAKEIGDDLAFDHLRELQTMEPERGKYGVDAGWVAWKRQQVDALKWELSKRNPRKYGDRVTHAGDSDQPLEVVVRRIGPKE